MESEAALPSYFIRLRVNKCKLKAIKNVITSAKNEQVVVSARKAVPLFEQSMNKWNVTEMWCDQNSEWWETVFSSPHRLVVYDLSTDIVHFQVGR